MALPLTLIAVPDGYRHELQKRCVENGMNIFMTTRIQETYEQIETKNITGIIIDNRWLRNDEYGASCFGLAQKRRIPTVTLIAEGGNKEIQRWFRPVFHQYLPLPFAFEELQAMMTRAKILFDYCNSHTLMFVWETDDPIATLFAHYFRDQQYNVLLFETIEQLREAFNNVQNPILIIDKWKFLNEQGIDFYRKVQAQNTMNDVPLIVGYVDGKVQEELFSQGANGCFERVSDLHGILRMIKALEVDPHLTKLTDKRT